ncbi:MAG: DUF4255 domain-containing protein [Crocinitomix sp.]|nr:DUF4255 domain-containing protein [Crocinitomix sp.]
MIAKALKQIVEGLDDHFKVIYPGTPSQVSLKSANKTIGSASSIDVTLINVEEDKVYKNHLNPFPNPLVSNTANKNPMGGISAMRINLYVLFAFHSDGDSPSYENTLTRLTHVLQYFQAKQYQRIVIPATVFDPVLREFNLEINYHNISLEDSNNMWSNLGGEQKPYAMYQIKMLELQPAFIPDSVAVIQDARISNPDLNADGETIFDGIHPKNDKHTIKVKTN